MTEIAPGVDLERDVLAQAMFPLRVADDLKIMDRVLFRAGTHRLEARAVPAGAGEKRGSAMSEHVAVTIEGIWRASRCGGPTSSTRSTVPWSSRSPMRPRRSRRRAPVRVAILSGEGRAFCAGGDIAAWGGLPPLEMWRDWTRVGHRAFEALARLRVPLIAALTGHAFGGGLELAADRRYPHRRDAASSLACRRRASAWCRDGRARNASRAALARRS